MRAQLPLVAEPRDGLGEGGVQSAGFGEEVPEIVGQHVVPVAEVSECAAIDGLGVAALAHLGQLLRVAEQ